MNWLCPLNIWEADCLSHGLMMWIVFFMLFIWFVCWLSIIISNIKKNGRKKDKNNKKISNIG